MKNWSLSKKIWGIVGVLSFAFVLSTAFSLYSISGLKDSLEEITGKIVKRDQLTSELRDNQRRLSTSIVESIVLTNADQLKYNEKTFNEVLQKQQKDIESYRALASDKGKEILGRYIEAYEAYLKEMTKVRELGFANKTTEASELYAARREELLVPMRKYINELNDLTAAQLADKSQTANTDASRAIWMSLVMSSFSILASILIAYFVLKALTRAISEVVRNLSDSSVQVSGAATQIASSAEELSQAATEQAASLEETAASVEEMNSMIAKNSENAKSAEETSGKSQDAVSQGKTVIQKMTESMEAINRSSEGMAETVKVIEQIDKKTKVINEIVNKTELLSFNASVEAARAGEHGKGFAVVAEEVGNLARMSGAAAEEIAALLEESIKKVNQMVQDTKRNVETGAQVARQCGEVFEEIVENVTSVSGMATEISSASQEQARGCNEITKAMTQLDQMTQQNAATSEECASAAEELSAQAEALKNAVSHLVRTVNGANGDAHGFEPVAPSPSANHGATKAPSAQTRIPSTVVQLKGPRSAASPKDAVFKKASGDAPMYDSDGFKDV